ncbi:hypothetical protein ACFWDZ_27700 [Micromonospora aurantiaca]|nr:hypothetical protein [Micromonospora aurantiaca]
MCAAPWPCQPARLLLLLDYRRDRVALSIHMAGCLFDRFIGWTARPSSR